MTSIIEATKNKNGQAGKPANAAAAAAILAGVCLAPASQALAGATIPFGDGKSMSVGLGLRSSFTTAENGAPNGTSRSSDFSLDSVRIYMGGKISNTIKGTFNTERDGDGDINLLDAYAQFEFKDEFNIWVGRMLPPSDRANLDGPYYLNAWSYPGVVSQYPAKFAGRDDGATIWGKLADKKLVYSVGAFMGHNRIAGASNQGGNLLYAARVQYNFFDPEDDPAYYTSSTYYGGADILAVSVDGMYQKDGVGTAALRGNYKSWSADILFEKKLADAGAVTLEGAYYDYGTGGVPDVATTFRGAGSTANVGGIVAGNGYLLGAAFLLPAEVGVGKFQPFARYQNFELDATGANSKQYDFGVNYVIDGHNARISLDYTKNTPGTNKFIAGLQLQF